MNATASSSSGTVDYDKLLAVMTKLLDKAGRDPRVTPRLLREHAEKRMSLEKGELKPMREKLKTVIVEWWYKQKGLDQDKQKEALHSLTKLARSVGLLSIYKGITSETTVKEKVIIVRKKLREKAPHLEFSDVPTEKEIAKAKKRYEETKDMEGIDESLILSPSAGRKRTSGMSDQGNNDKKIKTEEKRAEGEPHSRNENKDGDDADERQIKLEKKAVKRETVYSKDEEEAEF